MTSIVEYHLNGTESDPDPLHLHYAGAAVFFISLFVPIIGFFQMILGLGFGIAFDFITTMQLIHLIPVMRLYMPSSLTKMFKWFQYYNFKGIFWGMWDVD